MTTNISKFYGCRALRGTVRQKKWAADIRDSVFLSKLISEDDKIKLALAEDTFLLSAKFWIDNRSVSPSKFTYEYIVSERKILISVVNTHTELLARTSPTLQKDNARREIERIRCSQAFEFGDIK